MRFAGSPQPEPAGDDTAQDLAGAAAQCPRRCVQTVSASTSSKRAMKARRRLGALRSRISWLSPPWISVSAGEVRTSVITKCHSCVARPELGPGDLIAARHRDRRRRGLLGEPRQFPARPPGADCANTAFHGVRNPAPSEICPPREGAHTRGPPRCGTILPNAFHNHASSMEGRVVSERNIALQQAASRRSIRRPGLTPLIGYPRRIAPKQTKRPQKQPTP